MSDNEDDIINEQVVKQSNSKILKETDKETKDEIDKKLIEHYKNYFTYSFPPSIIDLIETIKSFMFKV